MKVKKKEEKKESKENVRKKEQKRTHLSEKKLFITFLYT